MSRRNGRKPADALDILIHGTVHPVPAFVRAATLCPGCGQPCHYVEQIADYQHDDATTPDCSEIKRYEP